jgi:hypothetical protein
MCARYAAEHGRGQDGEGPRLVKLILCAPALGPAGAAQVAPLLRIPVGRDG